MGKSSEANGFRIALVGCGYWGSKHARVLHAAEGVAEVVLVDSREDRLWNLSRSYKTARCFPALRPALPHVDAVVVASPPSTHLAVALGLPTISFFRDQRGHKPWLPVGPDHRTLVVHCTCIDHHAAPCQPAEKPECLIRLEPARVAEIICDKLRTVAPMVSPL